MMIKLEFLYNIDKIKLKFFKEVSVIIEDVFKRDNGKIIFSLQKFPTAWDEPVLSNGTFSKEELDVIFQNRDLIVGMSGELRFCQTTSEGIPRATAFKSLMV